MNSERVKTETNANIFSNRQRLALGPVQDLKVDAARATDNAAALALSSDPVITHDVTGLSPQRIRRANRQATRRERLALGPASQHASEIMLALRLAQAKGANAGCKRSSDCSEGVSGLAGENTNSVDMDIMDTYSLASSCSSRSSSLMSEITEIFPELKTTCDSIEVPASSVEIGNDGNDVNQIGHCAEDDVLQMDSRSESHRQQILDEMVIEMLASKVTCQTLTMREIGTFHKCKPVKNINDLREIGRGTYGRVLLARHIQKQTPLAIKQSCRSGNQQPNNEAIKEPLNATRARVKKEAVVHQLLSDSQFFPRFLGTLEVDNDLCLAVEFVGNQKSGNSFPLLEPPPLSMANGLDIAEDVVNGMMELHDHGLLHNDLKTDNVLLEKRNHRYHASITDFGMVTTMSSPLRLSGLPESLKVAYIHGEEGDYVAPEVILDEQSTSIASDVFSVGKILEDISHVVEERSPLLKDLRSLAIKCMKRNPESRPNLSFVLDQLGTMKAQIDLNTPFWKRLVKKHR